MNVLHTDAGDVAVIPLSGDRFRVEYRGMDGRVRSKEVGARDVEVLTGLGREEFLEVFELAARAAGGDEVSRILRYRDQAGRIVRAEVSDEVAEHFRREGRRAYRTKVLELAEQIDPEPGDAQVRRRMKEANLSYDLAAQQVFAEHEARRERRERELADPGAPEPTDAAICERMSRTGETYDAAAVALAVELSGGNVGADGAGR